MTKEIDFRELTRVITGLGFQEIQRKGCHLIYRHEESGLVVTLPGDRTKVPIGIALAIIDQIENYDISTREQVMEQLRAA